MKRKARTAKGQQTEQPLIVLSFDRAIIEPFLVRARLFSERTSGDGADRLKSASRVISGATAKPGDEIEIAAELGAWHWLAGVCATFRIGGTFGAVLSRQLAVLEALSEAAILTRENVARETAIADAARALREREEAGEEI